MSSNLAASLYLISGILFILALRGLSSPETSRRGNLFGILGMILAITVTFLSVDILLSGIVFIICALTIGGSIGAIISYRISMTAMPQLVAGFHSLVGLAAVLVALSAFYNPDAFELGTLNNIRIESLVDARRVQYHRMLRPVHVTNKLHDPSSRLPLQLELDNESA